MSNSEPPECADRSCPSNNQCALCYAEGTLHVYRLTLCDIQDSIEAAFKFADRESKGRPYA